MKKTNGKKFLAMLLALVLCMSLLPTAVFAEGEPQEVNSPVEPGSANFAEVEGVYHIKNLNGFKEFADSIKNDAAYYSGKTVVLDADIDLNNEEWTPIAGGWGTGFAGTFDGNNHKISNIKITQPTANSVALFSGATGSFKDLTLENAAIQGYNNGVAVLVANSSGVTFDNIKVTGSVTVSGFQYVGAIGGKVYANANNCRVDVADGSLISCAWQYAGGILGWTGEGTHTVSGCYSNIDLKNTAYAATGGIVGIAQYGVTVTGCCVDDITITQESIYDASDFEGSYEDLYGYGAISGTFGVSGEYSATITNNTGKATIVTNRSDVLNHGIVGTYKGSETTENPASLTLSGNDELTVSFNGVIYPAWVAQVGETKYEDLSVALKAGIASGETVELLDDIDLTGKTWTPVEYSIGTLTIEGNGKTITGMGDSLLHKTGSGGQYLTIRNLTFDSCSDTTPQNDGAAIILPYADSMPSLTFTNVTVKNSTVNAGSNWSGAFVGYYAAYYAEDNVTFNNCTVSGCTVTGMGSSGGLMGHGNGNANGTVTVNGATVIGNTITCAEPGSVNKAGSVIATIGAGNNPISISATVSGNTVTSDGTTITTVYGRKGTGSLVLTAGGSYDSKPITGEESWASVAEGYTLVDNKGVWTIAKDQGSVIVNDNNENNTASVTTDTDSGVDEEKLAEVVSDPVVQNAIKTNTVVSGVELTVPTREAPTGSGLQQVIAAAAAEDENVKAAIESAEDKDINVTVDVIVTPVAYTAPEAGKENSGSVLFELNPVARVTVKAGDLEAEATVPVDNDMIDQTKPITVSIYTGFKPAQIIHKDDNGGIIETFEGESIGFNGGVATVTIHHFSALLALPNVNAAQIVRNDEPVYFATLEAAIDDAEANETITMLKDVTLTDALCINKAVTIDLGGKNLLSADKKQFYVGNNVSVTVKNGTIDGSIQNGDLTACIMKQAFGRGDYSTGSLTLDNVVFTNEMDSVVSNASTGTLTLKGCTVPQSVTNKIGKLVVSDTKIGTVGTVGAAAALGVEKGEAEISGGSFGKVTVMKDAKLTVTGGTYSQDVTDYCAEHYYCKKATETTYTVQKKEAITVTVTCADVVSGETPDPQATATYGEATFTYSKDNEYWDTWENTYDGVSTYYVKAEVAEGDTYLAGEATTAFAVEYACQSDIIVKFNELVPGEYKMYINGADTGVYKFAMVAGGYTIQDTETGEYVCFDNGSIVMRATNPTAWTKDTAAFHVSVIETTRYWFFGWRYSTKVTKYYLNAAADGTIVVSKVAGVTHFADHYAAEAHDYKYTCNKNGTHTRYCAGCDEVFGTEKCDYDSTTHLCKYCGYYDPACVTVSCQVNVKKTANSGVLARLLYGKYTYTATITTSCTGSQITSVQYSLDGKTYTTGTSYRAGKNITKLYVKVATSAGTQSLWLYDSGKTSQIG